jgi:Arc/MetJ family transcription regulator
MWPRYRWLQAHMPSTVSRSALPGSVSVYSTRGGMVGCTLRSISPLRSSMRRFWVSILCLMPSISFRMPWDMRSRGTQYAPTCRRQARDAPVGLNPREPGRDILFLICIYERRGFGMAKTVIDLDDEALAEAARLLGTSSKKDTVNAALREIIDRRRRAAAVARMREMVAAGEVDFSVIERDGGSQQAVA